MSGSALRSPVGEKRSLPANSTRYSIRAPKQRLVVTTWFAGKRQTLQRQHEAVRAAKQFVSEASSLPPSCNFEEPYLDNQLAAPRTTLHAARPLAASGTRPHAV